MSHKTLLSLSLVGIVALTLTGCSNANQRPQANVNEPTNFLAQDASADMDMKQCQNMMKEHLGSADEEYDKRFIDMMIPHHQGAIDMAKDAQAKAQHPEIKKMSQDIIDAQKKEISQLKSWREQWYGSQQAAGH